MVIKLWLENDEKVVEISNKLPRGFLKLAGSTGFGVAPTTLYIREGAADGGRFRRSRRGPRNIDLPLAFQGESQAEVLGYMRELMAVLRPNPEPAKLFVEYPFGGEMFTEVYYAGGGDHQYGEDTNGLTYARWPLTLRSPSPYWTSTESVNFSLTNANAGRGLIKNAPLSNLELSSSSAIGSIIVENPGDVEAYPVWQLIGPADFFEASINGVGFRYDAAIPLGTTITIDTEKKTVVDHLGANKYAELAAAPKLFPLPPGISTLDILMDGVTSDSQVLFNIQPRYEVVF